MLKAFMASALILGSTLTMSAPVMAQTQESLEGKSYQVAQRGGSATVCTRDRYSYLNLRTAPSFRSRVIARIQNGEYLTILRSNRNWHKVSYERQIGWVSRDFVCKSADNKYTPKLYDAYICTRHRHVHLREKPTRRSRLLTRMPNGTRFIYYGTRDFYPDEFLLAKYKGISGYVKGRFVCLY